MAFWESVLILVLAVAIDVAFGEPPNAFHPVAWLGRFIERVMRLAPASGRRRQFAYGLLVVAGTTVLTATVVYLVVNWLHQVSVVLYLLVAAIVLKLSFSLRGLRAAALRIRDLLVANEDDKARCELKALVGRDTQKLDQPRIASAVIESVAENSCDSFVAPLFYYLIFGVPGAVAYRVVNTFDSMIGHHGKWEYLGKFAARLDDAVNYLPARLAALLLALSAGLKRLDMPGSWRVMWRAHGLTASPNAGWTIAAVAGALGVTLEKVGHYRIDGGGALPSVSAIDGALSLLTVQSGIWLCLCILLEGAYAVIA